MPSLIYLAPLSAAAVYAVASLALKRATGGRVGPWRVSFIANWCMALVFCPFWLTSHEPFSWLHFSHAFITGTLFFVGQVFTFLALIRGDVSVATPVLGTKVIFVAIFTVLLLRQPIPTVWWWAALITTVATGIMGGRARAGGETFFRSLLYGFSAAAVFALVDVFVQQWAPVWGFARFAPAMFFSLGLWSFLLVPHFSGPLTELTWPEWKWLLLGGMLLGLQAGGIAYAIMTFGNATLFNILYATRGVWSVLLVWLVGHWFGNEERSQGHAIMGRRLAGAGLLLFAVYLVMH